MEKYIIIKIGDSVKKVVAGLSLFLVFIFLGMINVNAKSDRVYVNLEKLEYSTNKNNYKDIVEYKNLEDFLKDYKSKKLPNIYITDFLFDGVSSVKIPDLDDFIEKDSNDITIKTLEIKVININMIGNVELTGDINNAMIGVDTNNRKGNINIVLNNVNIDTDSKKAPAIYVYNKDKNYTDCKVTIKTKKNSKNYIEGGKLKKVSLIPSDDLDKYISHYYYNNSIDKYKKYPSYYGIYTKDEIENILFATVQADNEDLSDGDPYFFYKGSGAISSDIDLYFIGEGYLKVTSKTSEGIETKGNLVFNGGKGDYEIYAEDDCLNTNTAGFTGMTVRNDITINVKSMLAYVSLSAKEGDAIDSNGKVIINGGNIYAIAHPKTEDAGFDSELGIYLNKGTIIAAGVMLDEVSNKSKQKFIYASFDEISADSLIALKNQDNEIITAFKTDRTMKNILYSSPDLNYKSYKILVGGNIEGKVKNGLYKKINNYTDGEEINYKNIKAITIKEPKPIVFNRNNYKDNNEKNNNSITKIVLSVIVIVLLVLFVSFFIKNKGVK